MTLKLDPGPARTKNIILNVTIIVKVDQIHKDPKNGNEGKVDHRIVISPGALPELAPPGGDVVHQLPGTAPVVVLLPAAHP